MGLCPIPDKRDSLLSAARTPPSPFLKKRAWNPKNFKKYSVQRTSAVGVGAHDDPRTIRYYDILSPHRLGNTLPYNQKTPWIVLIRKRLARSMAFFACQTCGLVAAGRVVRTKQKALP